jgi:tRNA 2-thiouridine synthesizing protein A
MKDAVENNEIELNTSGTECPIPVLKARKLCQTLSKGKIIKVIATDPLAEGDFRHYCEQSNYKFLSIKKENGFIYISFKT